MDKTKINGLRFFTRNGVLAEEKRLGQRVEIDLEIQLSSAEAGRIGNITQTVNYAEANELIAQRVSNHSHDLIEGLANTILDDISVDYQEQLDKIIIKIRKYSVSIPRLSNNIEIGIEREVQMTSYVALDSNVGDPYTSLVKARSYLNEDPQIQVVASLKLYEMSPYGHTDRDDFLNAVLKIDTSYTAEELLAATQGTG